MDRSVREVGYSQAQWTFPRWALGILRNMTLFHSIFFLFKIRLSLAVILCLSHYCALGEDNLFFVVVVFASREIKIQ